MPTFFDVVTVICFIAIVAGFFFFTDRDPRKLLHLLLCGVVFAVANQLGDSGSTLFGLVLIAAGVGYSVLVIRG
jgi:Mn2+/Fe2+ NRAMP family transporter